MLSASKTDMSSDARLRIFVTGGLVVVLACIVKVNSAPLFVFFLIWWLAQCKRGELIRSGVGLFLMASLLSVLWLYSNYTISGCWLYPADFTCRSMEHPQAVGAGAASYELEIILTHARVPVADPPLAFLKNYFLMPNFGRPQRHPAHFSPAGEIIHICSPDKRKLQKYHRVIERFFPT